MRGWIALVVVAVTSCSFVGANVPDHPAPSTHCPEGVVVLDVAGTGLFLIPATVWFIQGVRGDQENNGTSWGPSPLLLSLPAAVIGTLYLTSMIYGFHEHSRCQRLKSASRGNASG